MWLLFLLTCLYSVWKSALLSSNKIGLNVRSLLSLITLKYGTLNEVPIKFESENFGINSRLQWRFSPLSDFYLVYNDNYFVTDTFAPQVRSLTFKLTYWFNK